MAPLDCQTSAPPPAPPAKPAMALLGFLHGERVDGTYLLVAVFRVGEEIRLTSSDVSHSCLPSVEDIEGAKREALQVFGIWRWVFQPA